LLLGWAIACLLLVPLFRAWVAQTHGYINFDIWDNWLRKQVVTRFDAIAWGVLGAWLHAHRAALWQTYARPLLGIGLALLCITRLLIILGPSPAYMNYLHLSLEPFATLLLLPALSGMHAAAGTRMGPWHRAVRLVSDISYPLYLVNLSLIRFGLLPRLTYIYLPAQPGVVADVILYFGYWVLCFLFAWLLHRCWEAPIMRWRDRRLRRETSDGII
jgi:peptidoglycan/LPS O-acetylase OafA/YrhL